MKRRMPKVLLVLALVCVLAIGAAVAAFADIPASNDVTGYGEWYYSITVGEATEDDLEFYVEFYDENGDWFTTTSKCAYWTWDGDDTLSRDEPWDEGGTYAEVVPGDEVIVEITREGGDFTVAWYINGEWSYSAHCENSTFTDTVTWQVNVLGGNVTVNEFGGLTNGVAASDEVTGDGEWYYFITVGETTDDLEFYVEFCDENGDWFTTTSLCYYWTAAFSDSFYRDEPWSEGGNYAEAASGDEVVVEITREGGDFTVAWYINGEWSYSAHCENSTFTDTVTWQVQVLSGRLTVNEFGKGHPVTDAGTVTDVTEIAILDKVYTMEIDNTEYAWYSYTPVTTATYTLTSSYEEEANADPYIFLYYIGEDGLNYLAGNDDSDGLNFELSYELEAGVTYYYRLGSYSGETAEISIVLTEEGHEHSYANEVVTFDWADDYSTATATLRCDTCSYEATADCTVTSVTTEATTEAEGSIAYTAAAVINGETYTDTITVVLDRLTDTSSTDTEDEGSTSSTDTEDEETNTSSSGTSETSGSTSPKTGDVAAWAYYVMLLGAAAVAAVLAKKKVSA